ncbi:MAG: hypothetical protein B6I28_02065 [Fusobacteriia bacterium 4572_132]|nr:MAG: hypothetical protein B6I28_02065 [Fusobacteriia bacterium 4572_132]
MNRKGFTLLEIMIVVAIISILATVGGISLKGRNEKNELIKMTTQIPMFLRNLRDESFDTGKKYYIKFKLNENKIYVLENKTDELKNCISKLNLSQNFLYEEINEKYQFERETTPNGNFSTGFTLFLFDKERKEILKKITVCTTIADVKFANVNTYKPKKNITLNNYKERRYWIAE